MAFVSPSSDPMLPNPSYNLEQSITFMKNVTKMVVSQVAFYRGLCPESEFETKDVLGENVQFLKRSSNHFVVRYIMKALNGAFELLNQKHLKSLTFMVKDERRTFRLESYSLRYKYDYNSPALSYSTESSSSGLETSIDYIHNSTLDLLMRLQQTLINVVVKPLPELFSIDFELHFCESAPRDYLPAGYRFQTDEEIKQGNVFLQTPMKFRSGHIKSSFTALTFHTAFIKDLIREDSIESEDL